MKVPEYTLEVIMEKELNFLLPFHLFCYEKELNLCEEDEVRLDELKETYQQILTYLDRKMEEGKFQGSLSTLNDLVKDGILTLSEAARRASMAEESYIGQIKLLGL